MRSYVTVALLGLAGAIGLSTTASAGGIVEKCYMKSYVAPEYKTTTRKELLKKEHREWTNLDNGPGLVTIVRHPNVYIEHSTTKMVKKDYYVLREIACE